MEPTHNSSSELRVWKFRLDIWIEYRQKIVFLNRWTHPVESSYFTSEHEKNVKRWTRTTSPFLLCRRTWTGNQSIFYLTVPYRRVILYRSPFSARSCLAVIPSYSFHSRPLECLRPFINLICSAAKSSSSSSDGLWARSGWWVGLPSFLGAGDCLNMIV